MIPSHAALVTPASAGNAAPASCRYTYKNLAFDKADKEQSYWNVDVNVYNPTSKPVQLESMRYSLLHQQDTLLSDWKPSARKVLPGETLSLRTVIALPNKVLKGLPKNVLRDSDARFTLVGDAFQISRVGKVCHPQAVRQTIHVDMPTQMAKARKMIFRKLFSVG